MISQYPKFNWVVCHSPYSIGFDGVEGTDYGHTHHELNIAWGRTAGSALLIFSFFLSHNALIGSTFIGQSLEYSIDMEMVDSSTYVCHGSLSFKPVTQQ
jgi:hypothetical protein